MIKKNWNVKVNGKGQSASDIYNKLKMSRGISDIGYKMRILVWEGDDEFPPNAQVLYTANFADGFSAEDRVVAGDILIGHIKSAM